MKSKAILFDLDGVILNSFDHCFQTNKSFYSDMTEERYRSWFHGNIYDAVAENVSEKEKESSQESYWERFIEGLHRVILISGMDEILKNLSQNYKLVVISSTRSDIVRTVLERENVLQYFAEIFGGDVHENKTRKIQKTFVDFNIKPKDCIFVTDTLGDLKEAEKAGVESIAVSWGFHDHETLKLGKSKIIIHKPEELLKEISEHFKQ